MDLKTSECFSPGEILLFIIHNRYSPSLLSHLARSFIYLKLWTSDTAKPKANEGYMPVSSDIYALVSVGIEGRTPMVLLPVDVHLIIHAVDPIFGFKFGWYEPSHTNIAV